MRSTPPARAASPAARHRTPLASAVRRLDDIKRNDQTLPNLLFQRPISRPFNYYEYELRRTSRRIPRRPSDSFSGPGTLCRHAASTPAGISFNADGTLVAVDPKLFCHAEFDVASALPHFCGGVLHCTAARCICSASAASPCCHFEQTARRTAGVVGDQADYGRRHDVGGGTA